MADLTLILSLVYCGCAACGVRALFANRTAAAHVFRVLDDCSFEAKRAINRGDNSWERFYEPTVAVSYDDVFWAVFFGRDLQALYSSRVPGYILPRTPRGR